MMATFRVHIPEPCPMSMADMEPVQNGYHCAQCEKTVVDFRSYSTDEIQAYFRNKDGQRVCGILAPKTDEQLPTVTITGYRPYTGISRVFLAALLFVFGHLFTGCGSTTESSLPPEPLLGIMEPTPVKGEIILDTIASQTPPPVKPVPGRLIICDAVPDSFETGLVAPIEPALNGNMIYQSIPEFPGGGEALMKYLKKNVHYPEYEKEKGIQGKVYVSFIVAEDGAVQDIKIVRGVEGAPNFDAEVLRVMKSMPKWSPGKEGGKSVRVPYNLPIEFRLD